MGPLTLRRTPTDIFPNINIPVQAAAVSNDKESQLSILIRIPARHL
jgi:hypothetical protein